MFKTVIMASLVFSVAFAAPLSKDCIEEFVKLPKTKADFDIEKFLKELPPEVIKVKAQLKLPFSKPADNKKTDIGITVGCLKQFPESANAITPMLKDLSIEIAKSMAANKLGITENSESYKGVVESTSIIYLKNGQEIKEATVIEIGIDEVKYKVGTRAVVYVAKKSDVAAILHTDGVKEFFCNGTLYNSAIHFCHTDGQTYSCGSKPYNPATQSCDNNNQILNKCGENYYNPAAHFCHTDGQTYSCGSKPYNPATQSCDNNNQILNKCGENYYNPTTHLCHTDNKTYSCGNKPYNPTTHYCGRQNIFVRQ
jgi:hypothetical protein